MAKPAAPARKPAAAAPAAERNAVPPPDELRGKLLKRLAVAGLLISLLLGMLAIFDHLAAPPEEDELPTFSKRIPVPPKKEVSQPVTQTSELPPPPVAAKAPEEPVSKDGTIAPREASKAAAETLPPPRIEAKPTLEGGKNQAPPTSTVNVAVKPVGHEPLPQPAPAAAAKPASAPAAGARPLRPAVESPTSSPPLLPPGAAGESSGGKPSTRVLETKPMAPVAPAGGTPRQPEPPRLFSGFSLQAGVFSNPQLAEELHAKLTLSGVPSTLETRVQVGPFRTRQEAEAAQAKLRGLGIETVMVAPKGARR